MIKSSACKREPFNLVSFGRTKGSDKVVQIGMVSRWCTDSINAMGLKCNLGVYLYIEKYGSKYASNAGF